MVVTPRFSQLPPAGRVQQTHGATRQRGGGMEVQTNARGLTDEPHC